jgi:hypothetical protein
MRLSSRPRDEAHANRPRRARATVALGVASVGPFVVVSALAFAVTPFFFIKVG